MRILLVAGFAESIISFRGELIRSIRAMGHEVHVAAPEIRACRPVCEALEAMGVAIHEIPLARNGTNPLADVRLLWHLYGLMRRLRIEIFLGYTVKPVVYGGIGAWLSRVPRRFALITGLGFAFSDERKGLITLAVTRLYEVSLSRMSKVFFQNPDDERLFRVRGILPRGVPSIVVNGSGVDVSTYLATPVALGATVFLMMARLIGDKGVREYAAAAARVRQYHPSARFLLAGRLDSNPDSIAPSELNAWLADGHVEHLGHLDDVRAAIESSTVYVLPSYREGTPRTVLEAMAMARPIITTDSPGCRETVIDGENGYLVPVRSVDALVEAMLRFVDNPGLAGEMGRRSRQIAEEKYEVHKVNSVMLREMEIIGSETGEESIA